MPASDVEQLMRTVTHAFAEGNLKPLLAAIHPDIVWKSGFGQAELFRYGGTHRERGGVLDVTSKIAMDYTFRRLQPKEIVANDDHVWGCSMPRSSTIRWAEKARQRTSSWKSRFVGA